MAPQPVRIKGTTNGFKAWGGIPPMDIRAADGCVFRGLQARNTRTGVMSYVVYRIWPDHTYDKPHVDTVFIRENVGQGSIHAHSTGYLWATYFVATGDGQDSYAEQVPGFVYFT
jgi:hypothetical protein